MNGAILFRDYLLPKFAERPVLSTLAAICLLLFLVQIVSALTLDRVIEYREVAYPSPDLPEGMDGYTIAFLTDIHTTSPQKLREIARRVGEREVDLLLLGGDFEMRKIARTLDILQTIQPREGIFGVSGNHDTPHLLSAAMESRGMTLLENDGLHLRQGFYLAGLADLRIGRPDLGVALEGAQPGDFVLLLSHNPDVTMGEGFEQVTLTLSGHTHGGEATLLGLWAPALPAVSRYGQRFRSGFAKSAAGTDVYVSHGVGHHLFRMFARPQVIILTLQDN